MRRPTASVAALLAVALSGCAGPDETGGRRVVATLAPAPASHFAPEPGVRYPAGSRLVALDLDHPEEPLRPLSRGMAAAGGARVSLDGRSLAFVGRQEEHDPFAVWISDLEGGARRKLDGAPPGAGDVAWLPDGRLVVAAPVEGAPAPAPVSTAWALFVVAPEEGSATRITYGASELDPSVLADGRIVYSQWQPGGDGRPEGGSFSLFTVHPDGTGASPLHGFHEGPRLKLRAHQADDGTLFFVHGEPGGSPALRGVDWGRPLEGSYDLELPGLAALSAEPITGGELLVAATEPGGASHLWLLDPAGGGEPAAAAPEGSAFVHAVPAAARRRPQGHLSMVDPEGATGQLLCIDARPPGVGEARSVRLSAGRDGGGELLGEVPLSADGSFFAVVPADRPLFVDLLDAEGRVLGTTETPIWVRPREVRACVGCHESPLVAPPNRRPLAVMGQPVDVSRPQES